MSNSEILISGGYGEAFEVLSGDYIKITDVEGQQVGDFIAFNTNNLKEYLSTAQTRVMNEKITVGKEDGLFSNYKNKMFEIVEDTVGVHDTLYPCCDKERYLLTFGVKDHRNCRENLVEALKKYEIGYWRIPGPVNIFQNTPINPDGTFGEFAEPESRADDFIIVKALMDSVIAISACPMDLSPVNAWKITDLKVSVSQDLESIK